MPGRDLILVSLDKDLLDTIQSDAVDACIGYAGPVPQPYVPVPHLGGDRDGAELLQRFPNARFVMAVDVPDSKFRLLDFYGRDDFAQFVAREGYLSEKAETGLAIIVQRFSYVSADVRIGDFVKLNVGAQIHHDCAIGAFSTVAPGAKLMGNVNVGERCYIGANAVIRQNTRIGDGVMVGAGAVVVKDIGDGLVVKGNPARED